MVAFAIIVNVILLIEAWYDWYWKTKLKKVASHSVSFVIDAIIHVVSAYYLFDGWKEITGWLLISIGYHWLIFDLFYNWINGWRWDFYGTSAFTDRILLKFGKWHLVPKLLLIVIGLSLIL